MALIQSITQAIGKTPLLELKNIKREMGFKANIFAKLEYLNPAGSTKDRAALSMIERAEKEGKLKQGSVIVEPTSGNTGIGLASIAAARGYRVILTMPETMSEERRNLLKAYGAEIVLTEGSKGMAGAIEKANELNKSIEGSFLPDQFSNQANPAAHYATTGPEIWEDLQGDIQAFVAGVGTGGTLSGIGKYLKEKNPNIKVIAMEPATSPVLSKGVGGSHQIQGIGAGFVPKALDTSVYDEVIAVENERAFEIGKVIGKTEGFLVGISSGAALAAAIELAERKEYEGKNIVVIFPDSGDRYLSTPLFS